MSDAPILGFVGLGLMGAGFINRLVTTGYAVIGFDVVAQKCAAAKEAGAEIASSVREMAQRADIVACSVTTPQNLDDIVRGSDGLISAGRLDGKVFVDHSTTPIALTQTLGERLTGETGMAFIDAPVSGGRQRQRPAHWRSWLGELRLRSKPCGRSWRRWARSRTWVILAPGRRPN